MTQRSLRAPRAKPRRRLSQERGATAVVTAVFMVALLGMGAFAIDVASIYDERRELQSSADAGALAVAEDCAIDPGTCTAGTATITADFYADQNAKDGATLLQSLSLDTTARTVTVKVNSEDPGGETVLSPYFAQVIGFDGTAVAATATAAWGFPGSLPSPPLIISDCEWFDPARPPLHTEDPPYFDEPWLFYIHDGGGEEECGHSVSGFDLPGGFGWTDPNYGPCAAFFEVDSWISTDPGASPSTGCTPSLVKDLMYNKVVLLPYYNELIGTGNNVQYLVAGFGAFYVTGYNFGGGYKEPSGSPPCTGDQRCVAGHFVEETIYDGDLGGPDRGVNLIKLVS